MYYKAKGTAANGTRYTGPGNVALDGVFFIPAGATTAKLKIRAVNDTVYEDTETIKIKLLASPTGAYTIGGTGKAVALLLDND